MAWATHGLERLMTDAAARACMAAQVAFGKEQVLYARWTAHDDRRVVRLGTVLLYRRPGRMAYVKQRLAL